MNTNLAILALGVIAAISALAGFIGGRRAGKRRYQGPLQDFLLANRSLEKQSVVQLLLSTSFSLNGMLYQIWLGYQIGVWALLVQAIFAASYVWLAKYVEGVREAASLHAFLGKHFGQATRVVAATCSIIGFAVLVGWEFNVGRSTFAGLLPGQDMTGGFLTLFMVATVLVSVAYTAMGGLGGDALADLVQNTIKTVIYCLMIGLLFIAVIHAGAYGLVWSRFVPPLSVAIAALGVFGFITNVAFSLLWQFVDMSGWQSIIGSKNRIETAEARSALFQSALAVFIAPGLIGTLLGIFVLRTDNISSDNIMTKIIESLPAGNHVLIFVMFVAFLATIMSMVDGVLLAAAYSLVCDIAFRNSTLEQLDSDRPRANRILSLVRISLALIALVGGLGVMYLIDHGISLFNITYILIIGQLALTGPVLAGLKGVVTAGDRMAWSMVVALVVGFASFFAGTYSKLDWPLTGAGLFTILASLGMAGLLSLKKEQRA